MMLQVYYHNNDTKESVWTVPKELQDIKDRIEAESKVTTVNLISEAQYHSISAKNCCGLQFGWWWRGWGWYAEALIFCHGQG